MAITPTFTPDQQIQIDREANSTYEEIIPDEPPKPSNAKAAPQDEVQRIQDMLNVISNKQIMTTSLMGKGLVADNFQSSLYGADILESWRQQYPYRFIVYNVDASGKYNPVSYFRLPINPQELTITTPFAIKTTVTSRGILEEHNGIPLKQISIRGTTGIFIKRAESNLTDRPQSSLATVFAGTISAFNSSVNQAQKLVNAAPPYKTNLQNINSDSDNPDIVYTGYYQYHLLRLFLETYAEIKKSPGASGLRLALDIPKDRIEYIVTPQAFTTNRNVSSPMEYIYQIQLLAWASKTSSDVSAEKTDVGADLKNSQTDWQNALNKLTKLRTTINSFKNVVGSVRADIESNIFGPLNNVILAAKDLTGIAKSLADLPKSLGDSFRTSVIANWDSLKNSLNPSPALTTNGPGNPVDFSQQLKWQRLIGNMKNEISGTSSAVGNLSKPNSDITTSIGAPPNTYIDELFNDINFTNAINLSNLDATAAQTAAVNDVVAAALNTNQNDINKLINNLQSMAASLEPVVLALSPSAPEWDILYDTYDSIGALYAIALDGYFTNSPNQQINSTIAPALASSALAFWQSSADRSNIPFTTAASKFSIPFPFGASLEQLANIYLGDPTRWIEIVALNGLQHPYVDEDGFVRSFINNGINNQFNISDITDLYVGQVVYLSSNTQISTKRKITKISQIANNNYLIYVNGDSNLGSFTVADSAQLLAYLPYTVNSMTNIYIPSNAAPDQTELKTKNLTFIDDDPELVKFSRIDWLLDSSGDLAITKSGFQNLAYGKANLIQAAKMKLMTPPGGLILNPEYGAAPEVGASIAEISTVSQIQRINSAFNSDNRFNIPSSVSVSLQSGIEQISVIAALSNNNGILPITVPLSK
jgi:hypothetical protein